MKEENRKKHSAKVCPFLGVSVGNIHHYLKPFLQKSPDVVISYVGTNNCVTKFFQVVLDKLLKVKTFTQNSLPHFKIIISNVVYRTDDGKVSPTAKKLNNHLNFLVRDIVDNINIGKECLGKKGLYFIKRGSGEQVINFINKIRSL